MIGFEAVGADEATHLRLASETSSNRVVLLERALRSDRLRQLQAVPRCPSIAPFERVRDDHRLRLVHPAPLELAAPVDEFDVAQAIGSMLDGLAWLHAHDVTHGAVGPMSLAAGPTGGRLSLAGAFSRDATATPADDVFAALALAFSLLVGEPAGREAHVDPRLAQCASPAVHEAVSAGLHPDAAQRPSAALLATMVRGEYLPPIWDVDPPGSLLDRLQSSVTQMMQVCGKTTLGIGVALAMFVFVAALATAEQPDLAPVAIAHLLAEEPTTAPDAPPVSRRVPTTTSIARPVVPPAAVDVASSDDSAGVAAESPPVSVLSSAAVLVTAVPPPTTVAPPLPPPPPTTVAPAPIAPAPVAPTTSTTIAPRPTRRAVVPTTRSTTTTKASTKSKGSKARDDDDDEDDD